MVITGCATAPVEPAAPLESFLLPGYDTWFVADVAGNADLYEYVLDQIDPDLGGAVGRVDRIAGGMRLVNNGQPELAAVASGNLPKGGFQFALTTGRGFQRRTAQVDGEREVYYRQREGVLQLAVPRDDLLYIANGRILEMLPQRPPAELDLEPEIFRALRDVGLSNQPDALIIFDDPSLGLLSSLGVDAPALAITRIELSVTAREEGIDLGGTLHLRSSREAALFGRVGRLFVIVFVRALGLDGPTVQDSAEIRVEDNRVQFVGIPMSRDELVTALRSFSEGAP